MLPIVDRDREFRFIDANKPDYSHTLIACVLIAFAIFLVYKYNSKKKKGYPY